MTSAIQAILDQLTAFQWVAVAVIVVLAINGLATLLDSLRKIHAFMRDLVAHFKGKRTSDVELKTQAMALAKRIMDFVQERQSTEPVFDFKVFQESSNAQIKHSQQTQNYYAKEFAPQVSNLRDEFLKRKLQDPELDSFFQHPTNYIGLRMLAVGLASLAEKLRVK